MKIIKTDLSNRIKNALSVDEIVTVDQLRDRIASNARYLTTTPNLGHKSAAEIRQFLAENPRSETKTPDLVNGWLLEQEMFGLRIERLYDAMPQTVSELRPWLEAACEIGRANPTSGADA